MAGWQLGEHQEWAKYSNFKVATNVPLLVYIPGISSPKMPTRKTFPYINPFNLQSLNDVGMSRENSVFVQSGTSEFNSKSFMAQEKMQHRPKFEEEIKVKYETNALVELVDLFPSLVDLAGLEAIPQCPVPSSKHDLCTEGHSFARVIHNVTGILSTDEQRKELFLWKNATFSQYPRPSEYPGKDSDLPSFKNIKIMGYSMRTVNYRYAEWVGFNKTGFCGNWNKVYARELYHYDSDPGEDHNVAEDPQYSGLVKQASWLLHRGWTSALPPVLT